MMRNLKYTAALAAAVLFAVLPTACTDDPDEPADPTEDTSLPPSSDMPILWDVKSVASSSDASRVMVAQSTTGDKTYTDPDFTVSLEEICTAPYKDGSTTEYDREAGYALGLFGDYTYTDKGTGEKKTVYDFYRGDRLVYLPKAPEKPSRWDTNVALKYWRPGATYIFSAYYPQRLYNYTVSTSTATSLAMVYPSRKLQYDLLFGVKRVDTNEEGWNGKEAVQLEMKHALAALRFEFRLNFIDADFLTSVYVLNDEERHFFSQGTAIFGKQLDKNDSEEEIDKKLAQVEWKQDYNPPATEMLYKWVPALKYWYSDKDLTGDGKIDKSGDKDLDGDDVIEKGPVIVNGVEKYETDEMTAEVMLAKWGYGTVKGVTPIVKPDGKNVEPADNPVLMATNIIETAAGENEPVIQYDYHNAKSYYGTEQYYDKAQKKWVVAGESDVAFEGTPYCRNSGWLLIPPQESFGKLTLCFTTKKGGRTIYKVNLPTLTGTRLKDDGTIAPFSVKEALADPLKLPAGTDVWAAGYRYTYVVTISESNYEINVTIKDWNERKHSTEIIF